MPDLDSLASQVARLGSVADTWQSRAYWALAVAAVVGSAAGIGAWVVQGMALRRARELAAAQALQVEALGQAAAVARAEAASAISTARGFEAQIAEANARAAEAVEKAEKERLVRVKIEEKLAPRRLTAEQRSEIATMMSRFATLPGTEARQSVAVFASSAAFEAAALADQIAASLEKAGWDINRYPVTYGMSFSVAGVGLLTSSSPRGIAVARELAKALNEKGVLAFLMPEQRGGCDQADAPEPHCSQISVWVGDHP